MIKSNATHSLEDSEFIVDSDLLINDIKYIEIGETQYYKVFNQIEYTFVSQTNKNIHTYINNSEFVSISDFDFQFSGVSENDTIDYIGRPIEMSVEALPSNSSLTGSYTYEITFTEDNLLRTGPEKGNVFIFLGILIFSIIIFGGVAVLLSKIIRSKG